MSSRDEITLPATRPKSRKSLAHVPSSQEVDKENMTADIGALAGAKKVSKKSRSKSIGPGGLDALKASTGNRRKSLATVPHPPPKSILKPTMPPLREIPAHKSTRRISPEKSTPPSVAASEVLIDFSIDAPSAPTVTGSDNLPNPFQMDGSAAVNETRVTLRTEEEQQATARDREEKERKELEKEIKSRRDARRKSLANRRVSFAPEATLHTWDVVVEYQDSTTSSNSTNSTRRASSATADTTGVPQPQTPGSLSSDPSEAPSTPPEQVEEETVKASPAHQRDLHQKKRRRSSGIPPMNFNNPDEEFLSSSPLSGSSAGDDDEDVDEDDEGSDLNSGSDDDDGTMMSIDRGETTDMSVASVKSASSGSSIKLEEALRLASAQAGTQDLDFNEHGDSEMAELEDEDVVASFVPFKKNIVQDMESRQDQENVNPFSPAFKAGAQVQEEDELDDEEMTMEMTHAVGGIMPGQTSDDDEMSMDVTRALGSIVSNEVSKATTTRRKSVQQGRRQSTRRRSSAEQSSLEDETMDLTMAIGGIQPNASGDETLSRNDEDMTMEFTSVIGGVLAQGNSTNSRRRSYAAPVLQPKTGRSRESLDPGAGDDTMDMTVAIGGIMPSVTDATEQLDATMGMDLTTAIGGILPPQVNPGKRSEAKKIMEIETDLGSSPFQAVIAAQSSAPVHAIASETGSPSMAVFRGKGLRRSTDPRHSTTPKSKLSSETPIKKPTTPSKQITPQPSRPIAPGKTPPSKNVVMRTSSPKKLFKPEANATSISQSSADKKRITPNKLFQTDKDSGIATPNFLLTPLKRVSSGVGIDKEGLGSPRVAALLDRRGSIGDHARSFVPSLPSEPRRIVQFDDPRVIEEEIDREREQDEDRESGRKILEREADQAEGEKDATLNLKEMIQSLTPKKKSLKGRKSLHVGAAKGLLGKRPAELDEDEEDEENDGVKRLKGHQGSPVKNVKLQGPPSKAETTGRVTRARKSLEVINNASTPTALSPKKSKATTPRGQGRFKDAEVYTSAQGRVPFAEKEPIEDPQVSDESLEDDRIQLQDFLNMTSIRFMELTTTKRRHTIAPRADAKDNRPANGKVSLEDCVAAGAATIPMLELFQHACHELKLYISEGRKTVREIETETFEENPPLFREYISAPADVKVVMDNQLKNVKTHARLLSKGMWYEWRLTLLATLREGFFKMAEGMEMDEETLNQQQSLLDSVLPPLLHQMEQLEREEIDLQSAADELANCDQAELGEARQQLIAVDADIEAKKQMIAELSRQLQGKEAEISAGIERKEVCLDDIREAEKIRTECRGWSSNEISSLKMKVDNIEKQHGWTITGVSGTTTSMTYRKEIELVFDASSFQSHSAQSQASNSRIDLWYVASNRDLNPLPVTPEKDFFLQSIRDHIRSLPQAQTQIKHLLETVSEGWDKANAVSDDIRLLSRSSPTEITKTSDNSILIKSMLLIAPLTTKVEISFQLTSHSNEGGNTVEVSPNATVVYGERFNEPKMQEFLLNRCGNSIEGRGQSSKISWGAAVAELGDKLLARGRK